MVLQRSSLISLAIACSTFVSLHYHRAHISSDHKRIPAIDVLSSRMREPWVASQYARINEHPSVERTTSGFALLET